MNGCICQRIIVYANCNAVPLLFRACEIDVCQTGAIIEGIIANGGHTVREGYACQPGAIIEGRVANGGHTVRDDYACQTDACLEGI